MPGAKDERDPVADSTLPLRGPPRAAPFADPIGHADTLASDPSADANDVVTVAGTRVAPPPADSPASIGRFEIHRKLGEGGMGAVYLATDPTLGRRVAIKVMHGDGDTAVSRRRLLREAQASAQLSHEHVIVVYEVGTHDEHVYLAMEYVAGTTLRGWQADRDWRDILAMYRRAGLGLLAAHEAGLVHRDFKPDNVLVGVDGRVRVTDFGLVASLDDTGPAPGPVARRGGLDLVSMTGTGTIMGTPRYMAPEQHRGEVVDARADQFAFCVALYEAWYRQPPFAGQTHDELMRQVLEGEIAPAPATFAVPVALRDAMLRGLRRPRDDRFPSMRELLAALDEATAPASPRRRWPWIASASAVAAAVVGGIVLGGSAAAPSPRAAVPVDAGVVVAPAPAPPVPAPAPSAMVDVTIASSPPGAAVILDGRELGVTPYTGQLPRGDRPIPLVLRLRRYKDARRSITPRDAIGLDVVLEPKPPAARTSGSRPWIQ